MNARLSVLKVVGVVLALIGLIPAMPGVVQADVQPAPAGIVALGDAHTCALAPSGDVACWGDDLFGQVSGTPADPYNPSHKFATHLGPYTYVGAGRVHACAVKRSGDVDCWGYNINGQAADRAGSFTQVSTGMYHTCALRTDGALECWGVNSNGQAPDYRAGPYTQISVAEIRSCALMVDGAVDCWGFGIYGEAVGRPGPYAQVSVGEGHNCVLKPDGAVECWGRNDYGQAPPEEQPGPYIQVSAGEYHTCALRLDGAVDCWGWNAIGQAADQVGPYTQVRAGQYHTCALKPDGSVECWGANNKGQGGVQDGPYGPFDPRPYIRTHPQSLTVTIGDTAGFQAAASGWPDPTLQWQVSADGGNNWTNVEGATASPLEFSATLAQDGSHYRAVFTNVEGSTPSDAATLTVVKRTASVMLSDLSHTYDGQPQAATATTDPPDLTVSVTYDGSAAAPSTAGDYAVVATVVDDTYQGSASGTLSIARKAASVTPNAASKVYGDPDPALSGTLTGFVDSEGVSATYSRAPGEAAGGDYAVSATLSPEGALGNYAITYNTAAFTIDPLTIAVAADSKSKEYGDADPELTYTYSPLLVGGDTFSGSLTRDLGEEVGTYAIRQGTLALGDNYALTFVGAELTITPSANTAPVANPGGPYLGAVNTAIAFDGSASSDADGDPLTYAWTFGDDGTAAGAAPTHSYAAADVYSVCLTVNDGTVDSQPACTLAVVYDPTGGFVTGGGWIDSPAGAYKPDPDLSGAATFGFVSKYKKGAQAPTGTTQFQFDAAGFSFVSDTYEWLVVNQAGANAQFKGSGTVNGGLDPNGQAYKFMIWATDGEPDTLRIKIWWEAGGVETDVYDNGAEQAIGAGNIVVHKDK